MMTDPVAVWDANPVRRVFEQQRTDELLDAIADWQSHHGIGRAMHRHWAQVLVAHERARRNARRAELMATPTQEGRVSTTVIEHHGNTLRITVELAAPEKAAKAMALLADMIAEDGPERVRITFENVTLAQQEAT